MSAFDKFLPEGGSPDEISFEALQEALNAGACALIDVRETYEFDSGHAAGAVNIPLSRFDPAELPRSLPVVLMCRSGVRSLNALHLAREAGFTDARHYRGGMIGWANSGGEIV